MSQNRILKILRRKDKPVQAAPVWFSHMAMKQRVKRNFKKKEVRSEAYCLFDKPFSLM